MSWDSYFLDMSKLVASKSKDRSTKVGCVIVGPQNEVRTTGFNGFCRGVNDDVDSRHDRPEKYFWTEHAERNAIFNAARCGIPLDGCTAYISGTRFLPPCADCSRALIQSGIKRIVIERFDLEEDNKWLESFERSKDMLTEAGVQIDYHDRSSE